jgi:hypothetical protein
MENLDSIKKVAFGATTEWRHDAETPKLYNIGATGILQAAPRPPLDGETQMSV